MEFHLDALTKAMLDVALSGPSASIQGAAEVVASTIVSAVVSTRSGQAPRETVIQICKGAMGALLLKEKNLTEGAVEILKRMAEASQTLALDPQELLTWCLEGIAGISPMISPDARQQIRDAVNDLYMGTGEIFEKFSDAACRAAPLRAGEK